jgi:subtilisin family serine protease
VKVLTPTNDGTGRSTGQWSWIMAGMSWGKFSNLKIKIETLNLPAYNDAVARGIVHKSVQSISIGGDLYTPVNNLANAIVQGGMTVVVAAGNENVNAKTKSPASASNVLTIAASDINDARASFSNYGSTVDLFGPGVSILSSYNTCDTCYYYMSGTSMGKSELLFLETF